jgi:hypothetical protein
MTAFHASWLDIHVIGYIPAARPGKVLGAARVSLAEGITMVVPVRFSRNEIVVGKPSSRTVKGQLCIDGKVMPDSEVKFSKENYRHLTSGVISGLHASIQQTANQRITTNG